MIRDAMIASLLQHRLTTTGPQGPAAATILIDLCRDGLDDAAIADTLRLATPHIEPDLIAAIYSAAAAVGMNLAERGSGDFPAGAGILKGARFVRSPPA
jgi:hypothetical protein